MLSVLPEVDVAMVEDVGANIDIVEALWGQNHPHIISSIEQGDHLDKEVDIGHLISVKDADQFMSRDGDALRVDLGQAVVQVTRLAIHLAWFPLAP